MFKHNVPTKIRRCNNKKHDLAQKVSTNPYKTPLTDLLNHQGWNKKNRMLEPVVSLYSAGNNLGKKSAVSPVGVKHIPGDLRLLSGPIVQVLQGASQRPLDPRRLPLHRRARRLPCPSGAAEHRKPGGNAAAEFLGEDLLGAPRVELLKRNPWRRACSPP